MEPLGKTTDLAEYRGYAPSTLVSELDDERLFVIADGMTGSVSTDCGRTWSPTFQMMQDGAPMEPSLNKGHVTAPPGRPAGDRLQQAGGPSHRGLQVQDMVLRHLRRRGQDVVERQPDRHPGDVRPGQGVLRELHLGQPAPARDRPHHRACLLGDRRPAPGDASGGRRPGDRYDPGRAAQQGRRRPPVRGGDGRVLQLLLRRRRRDLEHLHRLHDGLAAAVRGAASADSASAGSPS